MRKSMSKGRHYDWFIVYSLVTVTLIISMIGCGGGGGGDSSNDDLLNSPLHYTGPAEPATLNETNAAELAIGSYSAVSSSPIDADSVSTQRSMTIKNIDTPKRQLLLTALQNSIQQADFNGAMQLDAKRSASISNVVYGDCGGSLSIAINMNESTGIFSGNYNYDNYCDNGITTSGGGQLSGTIDLTKNQMQHLRMSFDIMSVNETDRSYDLSGTIDFEEDANGSLAARMDVLMLDNENDKTYWLLDYTTVLAPVDPHTDMTISGKYYDPDHGYVTVRTDAPLRIDNTYPWPTQGVMVITGRDGATVRMSFSLKGCWLEADLDGDGEIDWTSDDWRKIDSNILFPVWKYGGFGTCIGERGLHAADIDNDGVVEIVSAASDSGFESNKLWYVAKKSSLGGFSQIWSSGLYNSSIAHILPADTDGDGIFEIYVGLTNGTIHTYNGLTFLEIDTFSTGTSLFTFEIGDTDGNGSDEIVVSDGTNLKVYASGNRQLMWERTDWGGGALAIGNVDLDASPEIISSNHNGPGYVINGADQTLEWNYANGFGRLVKAGDIDNDGIDEIIGTAPTHRISIFEAELRTASNELVVDISVDALHLADVDGDQIPEIIYGDDQGGSIHCHDGATLANLWSIKNPETGVGGITVGDVDEDGDVEVLWGAGGGSTGPDHLFIADTSTQTIEWQSIDLIGPLSAVDVGDVDDDGRDEIVMVSYQSNSGIDNGIIHIFDAQTHDLEWRSGDVPDGVGMCGVDSVKIGDVDGDGETEFVITSIAYSYDGAIHIYDGSTHTLEQTTGVVNGSTFSNLALGDVDKDGQVEIVVGHSGIFSGPSGARITVFDGATLQMEWQSAALGSFPGGISDIVLADIDSDGSIEMIASISDMHVYAFDGVTHEMDWREDVPAYSLVVEDMDMNGHLDILVGKTNGEITVFDGPDFTQSSTSSPIVTERITAIKVNDLDGDGDKEILIGGDFGLLLLNEQGGKLLWQSGKLGDKLGRSNQIVCRDTDNDGQKEVFIGSNIALYQFE